jgi:chemosensory pili system protein ChpC
MAIAEIRTIMAPLTDGYVVLPNSAVAEVLAYSAPEPFKASPIWLLGEIAWHGWQVPVISYEQLIDENAGHISTSRARILLIKTLGESTQVNYIGLVIQGLPKLKKVTAESLIEKQTEGLADTLFSKVFIDSQVAMIPELANLTHTVEQAAYDS